MTDSIPPEASADVAPDIRVLMMPRDTNAHGTIFGGVILSHIDQAGAVAAHRAGCPRVVTVALDQVEFHEPVFVGDLVSFYAHPKRVGKSSIRICVTVKAEGPARPEVVVTEADVTYVNVDESGKPIPIPE